MFIISLRVKYSVMEIGVLQLVTVGICCINIWGNSYIAACSKDDRKEKCIQRFWLETQKGKENLEDLSVDDRIIIRNRFVCLKIGTTGVLV
jgi:hypothetical protein